MRLNVPPLLDWRSARREDTERRPKTRATKWNRRVRGGFAYILTGALATFLLAATVHILAVLLVPRYAHDLRWERLERELGLYAMMVVDLPDRPGKQDTSLDPLFAHAMCLARLDDGPLSLSFSGPEAFWSMSLYDRSGEIVFSVNDRTALDGEIDLLVVTPAQRETIEREVPEALVENILVDLPETDLLAFLHVFAPDPAARARATSAIRSAVCEAAKLQ